MWCFCGTSERDLVDCGNQPCQACRGGRSIDSACDVRALEHFQHRGRCTAVTSERGYERHARLAAEWRQVTDNQREVLTGCEPRVLGIVFGQKLRPHVLSRLLVARRLGETLWQPPICLCHRYSFFLSANCDGGQRVLPEAFLAGVDGFPFQWIEKRQTVLR